MQLQMRRELEGDPVVAAHRNVINNIGGATECRKEIGWDKPGSRGLCKGSSCSCLQLPQHLEALHAALAAQEMLLYSPEAAECKLFDLQQLPQHLSMALGCLIADGHDDAACWAVTNFFDK